MLRKSCDDAVFDMNVFSLNGIRPEGRVKKQTILDEEDPCCPYPILVLSGLALLYFRPTVNSGAINVTIARIMNAAARGLLKKTK